MFKTGRRYFGSDEWAHGPLLNHGTNRCRKSGPHVYLFTFDGKDDVGIGGIAAHQLELCTGGTPLTVMENRRRWILRRDSDQKLSIGFLHLFKGMIGKVLSVGSDPAIGAGRADPSKLGYIEADRFLFNELSDGNVGIGGQECQPIRLCDIENMVGGNYVRST